MNLLICTRQHVFLWKLFIREIIQPQNLFAFFTCKFDDLVKCRRYTFNIFKVAAYVISDITTLKEWGIENRDEAVCSRAFKVKN